LIWVAGISFHLVFHKLPNNFLVLNFFLPPFQEETWTALSAAKHTPAAWPAADGRAASGCASENLNSEISSRATAGQ
jgi:hypothetical protein